jgi:hypothetical protein
MDSRDAYEWGRLYSSPWEEPIQGMNTRASAIGLNQEVKERDIFWLSGAKPRVKFCFVPDPSDIEAIRRIFNDQENAYLPACFIIVTQPDPSDERNEIIFDIFKVSRQSYLWHFNRVFTPPRNAD